VTGSAPGVVIGMLVRGRAALRGSKGVGRRRRPTLLVLFVASRPGAWEGGDRHVGPWWGSVTRQRREMCRTPVGAAGCVGPADCRSGGLHSGGENSSFLSCPGVSGLWRRPCVRRCVRADVIGVVTGRSGVVEVSVERPPAFGGCSVGRPRPATQGDRLGVRRTRPAWPAEASQGDRPANASVGRMARQGERTRRMACGRDLLRVGGPPR
jgi:hypothetical protein